MDYKEKYNKLVEAVKVLQETNQSDEGIQNLVNDNVPELKESEDERMRKWLIDYLDNRVLNSPSGAEKESVSKLIAWLEKQVEQKPEWTTVDEQNLNAVLSHIPNECLRRWLKEAIHVRYNKPTEWSEEDEQHIDSLLKTL